MLFGNRSTLLNLSQLTTLGRQPQYSALRSRSASKGGILSLEEIVSYIIIRDSG